MNKKIPLGITISLVAIASAVTFILTSNFSLKLFNSEVVDVNERAEIYDKLDEINKLVKDKYLGEVDNDELVEAISASYIQVLDDKYAHYYSADEYKEQQNQDHGIMVGIGISVIKDESGYIQITEVKPNTPAKEAGLLVGEQIVEINSQSVIELGYQNAIEEFFGEAETGILFTVRNDGIDREVALTRRKIEIQSVSSRMIDNIGYIKITDFNTNTVSQFNNALKEINNSNAKGIIFDVRNNGGGLLSSTTEILDKLLPEGDIVSATYKDGSVEVLATSDAAEIDLPMVILVNSRTASAAELFSAALRDYDKATLIGTNTYGKGIMQTTYPLKDGSSVKFTVATYQTPKTPNYDGIGLKPNYEVYMQNDSEEDLAKLDATTDTQLKKALEVLSTTIG